MAQIAVIALKDGQATPVTHNFSPASIDSSGTSTFLDRVAGLPAMFWKLTRSLRSPLAGQPASNRVYRKSVKIVVPMVDNTIPSNPVVVGTLEFNGSFTLPEKSSTAQRSDIWALTKDYFANATAKAMVVDLESDW